MEQTFQLAVFAPEAIKSAAAAACLARLSAACKANGWAQSTVADSGPNVYIDDIVLFAGATGPEKLKAQCELARKSGAHVIIVSDAVESTGADLFATLCELNEKLFQLSPTAALVSLVKGERRFIYPFPKADSTTTTVVLLENATRVLVIERDRQPFKGMDALPGGFLNIQLEDLPTCAARELFEETNIKAQASDMRLVDVRSGPDRDNRGHVVDHGYVWFVPESETARVLAEMKAKDDAANASFKLVADVLAGALAFDHMDLLKAALAPAGK